MFKEFESLKKFPKRVAWRSNINNEIKYKNRSETNILETRIYRKILFVSFSLFGLKYLQVRRLNGHRLRDLSCIENLMTVDLTFG